MRKSLFGFFNKNAQLDFLNKSDMEEYFQEAASRGNTRNIQQSFNAWQVKIGEKLIK